MAKHNSARRGRSRKRRPAPSGARRPARPPVAQGAAGSARERKQSPAADERPQAPWHPLPLSELLILVGAVAVVVGLSRSSKGFASGGPTLLAGIGAAMIGTIEVTLREHRGGYRSHALLLAVLPVIVFHSAVILIVAAFTVVPRALSIGILPLDVALFAVLFKFLRARYVDARRERNFATRR